MKFRQLFMFFMAFSLVLAVGCKDDPTCDDGEQNQGETGIDCGGPCPACGAVANCFDGVQNQDETGIDCGGVCPDCPTINECPTVFSNTLSLTADGNNAVADIVSAQEVGGLLNISGTVSSDFSSISISQATYAAGTYDVGAMTIVQYTDPSGTVYTSQLAGSSGAVTFSTFENDADCKYVTGSFNVNLPEAGGGSIQVSGQFTEIDF